MLTISKAYSLTKKLERSSNRQIYLEELVRKRAEELNELSWTRRQLEDDRSTALKRYMRDIVAIAKTEGWEKSSRQTYESAQTYNGFSLDLIKSNPNTMLKFYHVVVSANLRQEQPSIMLTPPLPPSPLTHEQSLSLLDICVSNIITLDSTDVINPESPLRRFLRKYETEIYPQMLRILQ